MVRWLLAPLLFCVACGWPRAGETPTTASPIHVAAAGALEAKEIADGTPDETTYGWRVQIAGGRARYYQCTSADACSYRPVDIAAESVRTMKVVGRARPTRGDGTSADEVDVYELTLAHETMTSRGGVNSDARGLVVR